MFKKKWVWVVALFLVINIAGLVKIISLLEEGQGRTPSITSFIRNSVRHIPWLFKKAAKDISYTPGRGVVGVSVENKTIPPAYDFLGFGVLVGIDIEITKYVNLNVEGRFVGETALTTGATVKF